jgi:hypothetical protein
MPSSLSPVTLAGRLSRLAGGAFVILEIVNAGGSQNLAEALPSLDDAQLDIAEDGLLILGYDTAAEAQDAFNAFTVEARAGYEATGSMVETTVRYVGAISGVPMTTCNGSGFSSERTNTHVFRDGQLLSVDPVQPAAATPPNFLGIPFGVAKSASMPVRK